VAVVDDERDVRESVRFILEGASHEFVAGGFYENGREALASILTHPPDVVLMDIRLPDISGIDCTRRLTSGLPDLRVVMISALDDRQTIQDAIEAGCHGYLTKPFGVTQCLASLRCALSTRSTKPQRVTDPHAGCPWGRKIGDPCCFQLTDREVKVLGALTDGWLYKQIAEQLKLSQGLAHKLVNRVFRKLHVRSRQDAMRRWVTCSRCPNWSLRGQRSA
jgi:DNA-binding NarL/FixJ family response regulator